MSNPRRSSSDRGARITAVASFMLAALLVLLAVLTAVTALQQMDGLKRSIDRANVVVRANVRVLAQVQRELWQLRLLMADKNTDPAAVRERLSYIDQRLQEATLPYQQATYGSQAMLQKVQTKRLTWNREIRPQVLTWAAGGPGAEAARADAEQRVTAFELQYNVLLAEAELNRKRHAAASADEAQAAMDGTRDQMLLVIVMFLAAALAMAFSGLLLQRLLRERALTNQRLTDANSDLQRYAHVVHATASQVVILDDQGRIEWVNDAFVTDTGWTPQEVLGRSPMEFMHGPLTDQAMLDRAAEAAIGGESWRGDIASYNRDGEVYWSSMDVAPLHDENGHIAGFVSVSTDVTPQHEAASFLQQARDAAERTAAEKAAFLATMSHEIRTPLNSVLGLTDLLRLTELNDEQRDYVDTAHRSGQHLLALLNNVLDYSALDAGRFATSEQPFDVRRTLADAVDILSPQAEPKDVELRLSVDDSVPTTLVGDEVHLRQILLNLAGNSVKFTERGSVQVSARLIPDEEGCEAARLSITVTDTGIGIPDAYIATLFEPFVQGDLSTTRRHGGTGLGLAITRQLVEGMKGTITLTSEVGVGTTVEVVLPMLTPDAMSEDSAFDGSHGTNAAMLRLLVAEDDRVNQTVLTQMLRRLDLDADIVFDGSQAVDAVATQRYDIVLLDVQMPVLDGVEAMLAIREQHGEHAPYLTAVTADALAGDRERYLDLGMDDYLAKPISLEALREMIARARSRLFAAQRAE